MRVHPAPPPAGADFRSGTASQRRGRRHHCRRQTSQRPPRPPSRQPSPTSFSANIRHGARRPPARRRCCRHCCLRSAQLGQNCATPRKKNANTRLRPITHKVCRLRRALHARCTSTAAPTRAHARLKLVMRDRGQSGSPPSVPSVARPPAWGERKSTGAATGVDVGTPASRADAVGAAGCGGGAPERDEMESTTLGQPASWPSDTGGAA